MSTHEEALRDVEKIWTKNTQAEFMYNAHRIKLAFAQAILDAEKREKERCAKIADDLFDCYSKPHNFDLHGKLKSNYVYVDNVAEVIRKGE